MKKKYSGLWVDIPVFIGVMTALAFELYWLSAWLVLPYVTFRLLVNGLKRWLYRRT